MISVVISVYYILGNVIQVRFLNVVDLQQFILNFKRNMQSFPLMSDTRKMILW